MITDNAPAKVGLLRLLYATHDAQFVIPVYQRNYTWKIKDINRLFDDIKAVLSGERDKHFVGIIIYLERVINPLYREKSIIDGQQRLTTTFLMLYAIKEAYLELGEDRKAASLERNYLVNDDDSEETRLKLKPLVSDDDVYRQIVKRDFDHITNPESNVYKNFQRIKANLDEVLKTYTIEQFLEALDKLYVVAVPISESDHPQKIFESINATGEKLTASDLIRNFMLMSLDNNKEQENYYNNYWKKLEQYISSDPQELEAYFRFFIAVKRQIFINKNGVYQAFTAWYEENKPTMKVEDFFSEVVKYAECYAAVYTQPVKDLNSDIREAIAEFRQISSEMPAPLLMEFYWLYKKGDITGSQFSEMVNLLMAYLMRRALCNMKTSDITRFFPSMLKETLSMCNGNYANIVDIFKKNLVNKNKGNAREMPDDNKLRQIVSWANMYNLRTSSLLVFFRKLENKNNNLPLEDFSKLSIEHLMPQTPTAEWLEALQTDKENYEANLHRLGNLTFATIPDNSKMGNKDWGYKNRVLAKTQHLTMNTAILAKERWTLQDIDDRTQELIDEINLLYPYSESADVEKIPIHIEDNGIRADAYFYPDSGSVEIIEGSTVAPGPDDYKNPDIDDTRNGLIEDGIIQKINGVLTFTENHRVDTRITGATALSTSAVLILRGHRNGWAWWQNADGISLNKIPEIKARFNKNAE